MNNPVAPVEGHYARLRNGMVLGPLFKAYPHDLLMTYELSCEVMEWKPDGTGHGMRPEYDIIATISPEAMQAVTSGELERLRAAMQEVRLIAVDAQLRATYQRTALESISAKLRTALEGSTV
jgi:hypothetical protein